MKRPAVGDTFAWTRACDRYQPIYYAAASGDFNPLHIDEQYAKAADLPGVILQGMCTLAWAVEAASHYLGDPAAVTAIHARFSRPVAIDDTITFGGKVTEVEGDWLRATLSATNQRGEEVLQRVLVEAEVARTKLHPGATHPFDDGDSGSDGMSLPLQSVSYKVGEQKLREFALAVAGAPPAPDGEPLAFALHAWTSDSDAAAASPWGNLVSLPTFAAVYAMPAFREAFVAPDLGVDVAMLVHGEQSFRFHRPVIAGDVLTTRSVLSFAPGATPARRFTVGTRTTDSAGALVTSGTWTAVIRKRRLVSS